MKNQNGIILWVLGGTGVLFIVAAYKNKNPQALLLDHLRGTTTSAPISGSGTAAPTNGTVPTGPTDSGLYYGGNGNVQGTLPAVYQNNPQLFIATGSVNA